MLPSSRCPSRWRERDCRIWRQPPDRPRRYAERLFTFPQIGSLTDAQAIEALRQPAKGEGVVLSDEALTPILQVTQCRPYFIQQFGLQAWDVADRSKQISAQEVRRSIPLAIAELDNVFFRVRAGASTRNEQRYMRGMGQLGPGPVRTSHHARAPTGGDHPNPGALLKRSLCFVPGGGTSTSPFPYSVTTRCEPFRRNQ